MLKQDLVHYMSNVSPHLVLVITQNFSVCEQSAHLQPRHARRSFRAKAFAIPASHRLSD